MVHYLRKTISYTDDGDTITVGTIPAGSLLLKPLSGVSVNVAFNGNSSNILDIGPSTNTDLWMTDGSLASIAFVPLDEAVTMLVSADTVVQCAVTATASASAGSAEVVIAYLPDNDG
jgi:hypothetical protein